MRPLVRSLQVLGLAVLVALAAGAVVSADSSSFRQAGYGGTGPSGTTGPTGTATATPTKTPIPTATPAAPRVTLKLLAKGTSKRKGIRAKAGFNRQGRVTLRAKRGKRTVGKKAVNFRTAGRKATRIKLKRLGRVPARVTVIAKGRDTSGRRSNTVKKKITVKR